MSKYSIGVDFGTLSARALIVDVSNGYEVSTADMLYPHGVMSDYLPTGEKLDRDWALQCPTDYIECLEYIINEAMRLGGVSPDDIIGLGIDFTASTFMPILEDGTPMCLTDEFARNPHSWVKLWKHHSASDETDTMNRVAIRRGEKFLSYYGGKISSEWTHPKILEILNDAPEIYERAAKFIEARDWLTYILTGSDACGACAKGYKALWMDEYPSREFFREIDPRFEFVSDKLSHNILPSGSRAGLINERGSKMTGLNMGTPVSVASVDAHVALPAAGKLEYGRLMMIIGTSTCDIMMGERFLPVKGMCGAVNGAVAENMITYEMGQSCVGDSLNWFAENFTPESYVNEARVRNISVQELLTEKASLLDVGQSGLIALDWLNGNRSVLVDFDLSGMILGMTLSTRSEEVYRALIEATAFGARTIVEQFETNGVNVNSIVASGGIPRKNPLFMDIYANVLNRNIELVKSSQASALGAAMLGACAAGIENGGYDTVSSAAAKMGGTLNKVYLPDAVLSAKYDTLYKEYKNLHDLFGKALPVMKTLKAMSRPSK